MTTSTELGRRVKACFGSRKPQLYIIHTSPHLASYEIHENHLNSFYDHVERINGRDWPTRVNHRPLVAVGFWERLSTRPRCHVLVAGSGEVFWWLFRKGTGVSSFREISRIEQPNKAISKLTNSAFAPDSFDDLYVYKAPPVVENYEQPPYRPLKHWDDGGAPADRPPSRRPRKVVPDEASLRKWGLYK